MFVPPGFEGLKFISVWKDLHLQVLREFQFIEVMANEVVRHFSNLTAKECWESAKRVLRANHALGGITDFNSSEHLS